MSVQGYARAVESGNLRDREDRRNDTDLLKAAAWSDRQLGSNLMRLYAGNCGREYRVVLDRWGQKVWRMNLRGGWGLSALEASEVATLSLARWLVPTCPACLGRKKALAFDTQGRGVLSDEDCPSCGGSGERPVDCPDRLRGAMVECLSKLAAMYASAVGGMRNRLRG